MKASIASKLTQLTLRLEELNALLASQDVAADMDNYRRLTREHSEITPVVELYRAYRSADDDLRTAQEMAEDPGSREFAESEIRDTRERLLKIEAELQKQLLPKDPNDERNIFLEIRAGTGGEESALFAADLFRMYGRFAERNRWQVEVISQSASDLGGYREIIAKIVGQGAYSRLKFESGAHRVQRVPDTETQGRIHTSACTVAVLPEADEVQDIVLNPAELKIDTYRASGAGGQHVNKTDSAVRITHRPSGIVVQCQNERSQSSNRATAMAMLRAKLLERQERERQEEIAREKGEAQDVNFGSQIRSYALHPYTLVKDHRTGYEMGDVQRVLDGDLDGFVRAYLLASAAPVG